MTNPAPKSRPRCKQMKGKAGEQDHGTETTPATSQPAEEIPLAADVPAGQPGDVELRAERRSIGPDGTMYWFRGNGPAAQLAETSTPRPQRKTPTQKAHRVHCLLLRDGVEEWFREQLRTFYEKLTAWEKANEEYDRALNPLNAELTEIILKQMRADAALARLTEYGGEGKESKVRRRLATQIGQSDYYLSDYYVDAVHAEFAEAEKELQDPGPSPLDWLESPRGNQNASVRRMLDRLFGQNRQEATTESERLRAYVLLAVLHDKALEGAYRRIGEGIWPADEPFVQTWWDKMTADPGDNPECGWTVWHDEAATALAEVKPDLRVVGLLAAKGNGETTPWTAPEGYTGAKSAGVPRSTLETWECQDNKPGGPLEGKVRRDPRTQEKHYPTSWLNDRKKEYKPRKKSS